MNTRQILDKLTALLAAAFGIALLAGLAVGVRGYVVLSGSMAPAYPVGALLVVRPVQAESISPGQVITYRLAEGTVATHRVTAVQKQQGQCCYRTKGDANPTEDAALVPQSNVIGTPIFAVPYLGTGIRWLQSTAGRWASIAVGTAAALAMLLSRASAAVRSKS